MSDPGKVIVALGFFATLTYIVRMIASAAVAHGRPDPRGDARLVVDEDRMARLEQAVEAIALEVERIAEGQRFTTKLLAERAQAEQAGRPGTPVRQVTPH